MCPQLWECPILMHKPLLVYATCYEEPTAQQTNPGKPTNVMENLTFDTIKTCIPMCNSDN